MEEVKKEIIDEKKVEKVSIAKHLLKAILYFILGFFVLNSILYIGLSIPYVQNRLVTFASQELSSMLKTEVTVSEVRFSLFNYASFKDLYIEDQSTDTLAYVKKLEARIKPIDYLIKGDLRINQIQLSDFYINVTANDSVSDYNFQFIIDEFSSPDSTRVDTTTSSLEVKIDDVKLSNGRLRHRIKSSAETRGVFNYADVYATDFSASVSIHSIDMDKLDIHVNSIAAKEKSGLEITELKGHVLSDSSRLRVENLLIQMPHSHLTTKSLFYDLDTDEFGIITDEVILSPKDMTPFMAELGSLSETFSLNAIVKGKLPAIDAEKLQLKYGSETLFDGHVSITSYENLANAQIELGIDKLQISPKTITDFARLADPTFVAPDVLNTLGKITLEGHVRGILGKFHLDTKATMNSGVLKLVADGGIDTTFTNFDIVAKLSTINFDLRPIAGEKTGLGKLSMHANLEAHQKGKGNLHAKLKGSIESLDLMHGKVKSLPFAGYYNPQKMGFGADAKLHFAHLMAGFEMSNASKPDIRWGLSLKDFDVAHFYKNKLWNKPMLSFDMKGDIKKLDIDNLNAEIVIKNVRFVDDAFNYLPGNIELKAWQDTANVKHINFSSSIMSANIEGDYKFSTIADEFAGLMHNYLSNVFPLDKKHKIVNANDFRFDLTINNTEELGYIFDLPLDIIDPLVIDGIINTKGRTIDIVGQLPHAHNSSVEIKDVTLSIANMDSAFNIKLNTDVFLDKSKYDLTLAVKGADNSVRSRLDMDTDSVGVKIKGTIDALAQFTLTEEKELQTFAQVIPSDIVIGNLVMHVLPAKINNVAERTEISNMGIGINQKKYLDISGAISNDPSDSLKIAFTKAQIADVLQGLNINDIYAEIDGNILATNFGKTVEFYTKDLKIADITVHNDTIGTVDIDTEWNESSGGIKLASHLTKNGKKVIELDGLVNPSKETLNLHMDIEHFAIDWLKPLTAGILNDISGNVSSHFTIKGTFDEPVTEGFFGFNNARIGIDYTNVTYFISDTIDIRPEYIGFDNLILKDSEGNTGRMNARITHRNFKNIKYHLDVKPRNLMVLNTQSRTDSLFYGRLYASGDVKIEGSDKGINLDMKLQNGKKSSLNITLPQTSEASDYQSVVYINVPEEKLPKEEEKKRGKREELDVPINIKLRLDVDPELELGVVIDPETGDQMTIKGNGSVNFGYNLSTNNMTVFGDYRATDGGVRLNLRNISRLEFKIKEGSKLDFIGDPFKTKFDIIAFRRIRADLRTLDQSFELDSSSPRVQVDCLLGLSGNITKMDLAYDVELYEASDDQNRKMKSLVNTDELRIKQFAYLIASGTFYSNTNSSGANFTDGMWTSLASSAISSGLNSALGGVLGDKWEVGTDFTSGDGTFSDMNMSVHATTRLFNDKLKLHANVGYRSESSPTTDDSFIGDFEAEYMLNTTWTLKAYSHTNDRFYRQAATTQGVGIVFTREGPTFKRMFLKRRRGQWRHRADSTRTRSGVQDSLNIKHPRSIHQKDSLLLDSSSMSTDSLSREKTDMNRNTESGSTRQEKMPIVVYEEKQPAVRED